MKNNSIRGHLILFVSILSILVLAACGGAATPVSEEEPQPTAPEEEMAVEPTEEEMSVEPTPTEEMAEPDKITLGLNWNVPYSGWAGFYVAQADGYYADENLEVEFLLLKGSNPVNQSVGALDAQLGVSGASSVLVAASQGIPLTVVSAHMQTNPEGVIADGDEIQTLEDFFGPPIGINPANPTVFLFEAKLRRAGLDPDEINWVVVQPENQVPLLLEDEIDAIMGYWDWENIIAEDEGLNTKIFPMSDEQIQIYGNVVSANRDWLSDPGSGDIVKRFLSASLRGWIDACNDPHRPWEIMMEANPEEDPDFLEKAMDISVQLIDSPDAEEFGYGWMDAKDWVALQDALLEGEVIDSEVDMEEFFTNEYLPDNALDWATEAVACKQ